MFFRWKKQKLKRMSRGRPAFNVAAEIVQSVRVDGRPRQKVVKWLSNYESKCLDDLAEQRSFWERADKNLDAMNLEPARRMEFEAKMLAVVPRPDPLHPMSRTPFVS
jgi:hypothetical protein